MYHRKFIARARVYLSQRVHCECGCVSFKECSLSVLVCIYLSVFIARGRVYITACALHVRVCIYRSVFIARAHVYQS
jgi:hypothetical protein